MKKISNSNENTIDDHCIKEISPNEKQELIKNIPEPILKPSLGPYEKQLNNNKSYYQKHKGDIINRVKE